MTNEATGKAPVSPTISPEDLESAEKQLLEAPTDFCLSKPRVQFFVASFQNAAAGNPEEAAGSQGRIHKGG